MLFINFVSLENEVRFISALKQATRPLCAINKTVLTKKQQGGIMKTKLFFITVFAILGLETKAQHKQPIPVAHNKQEAFNKPDNKTLDMLAPKSLIQIDDSIYEWDWDTLINNWAVNPYEKSTHIVYDAYGNETNEIWLNWNGTAWGNFEQYTYTYDANNNRTSYLHQHWSGTAWVNNWQWSYNYDANNNRTSWLSQTWNGTAWVNSGQYTYTYDVNNNLTSELHQTWSGTAWVNSWQYNWTYDAYNNQTSWLCP